MMQVCTTANSHTVLIASGKPFNPSQTTMHTSATPRFLISVSTASEELRAFPAVAGPQPQDVAFTVDGHPDRDVDRSVGDLTVADLDVDGVDEHHRIHPIEGPVLPFGHLLEHLVGDPGDGVLLSPSLRRYPESVPRSRRWSILWR